MTLPNETIAGGAAPRCCDCDRMARLDVYRSGAGYYIGSWCACGPYSRESGYYPTERDARRAFAAGGYER
jgi:non-ribosomal peptide synthetase component E (peptide arylation enzyme)